MDWVSLGHAGWWAKIRDLRILFDPLLAADFHGGVQATVPMRMVNVDALRPDILVISHCHPDHFDVPSVAKLARRYPEAVVLTADKLVGDACRKLGFSVVRELDPWHVLELNGLKLVTTPSFIHHIEWGMVVAHDDGVVWNQVDTVLGKRTKEVVSGIAERVGRSGLDLALVQWQPLIEIAAQTSGTLGFPMRSYGLTLDRIAALNASAIVPSAAGFRHIDLASWLNAQAYPVTEQRLLRDLAARCPQTRGFGSRVGACYRVEGGETSMLDDLRNDLVQVIDAEDDRLFRPFQIPALTDPNLDDLDTPVMERRIAQWIATDLLQGISRVRTGPVRLALEVIYPDGVQSFTFVVGEQRMEIEPGIQDWDVLNAIAASQLYDVIEGRRHWGEPLIGGWMRSAVRAYEVDETGLKPKKIAPFFLYYGLSYRKSNERWVDYQLARELG